MNRLSKSYQSSHAPDDTDHCDRHIGDDHRDVTEHEPKSDVHHHPGDRGKKGHLAEHFGAKRVPGDRVSSDIKLVASGVFRKKRMNFVRDLFAVGLWLDGYENGK